MKTPKIEAAKIGHNSNLTAHEKDALGGYVKEIERIKAEQKELAQDLSETYQAAKEQGYDTKALRHLIKMRAMEASNRNEFEAAVDAYSLALGMLADTPLGKAAVAREKSAA